MPIPELHVTTNFSFLDGASHPEEFAREAAAMGLSALAVTDRNSVAGVVRAHQALRDLARAGLGAVRTTDRIGHGDVVARARSRREGPERDAHDDSAEDHTRRREALRLAAARAAGERPACGAETGRQVEADPACGPAVRDWLGHASKMCEFSQREHPPTCCVGPDTYQPLKSKHRRRWIVRRFT